MTVAMRAQNKAVELKSAIDKLVAEFEYQTKYQITQMVITTQHAPIEGVNQITATLDTPAAGTAVITMQGQNVIWPPSGDTKRPPVLQPVTLESLV